MEILNHLWNQSRVGVGWAIGRITAIGMAMVLGLCLATASSPEQPFDEYQVKAAFLYNFPKFVQWPAETFQTAAEPLAICVVGQDPFGRSLADTVAGRAIEGRSLVVRHIPNVKQAAGCNVLFIGAAEYKPSLPALAELKPGILTVGESGASGAAGLVINFRVDDGKVGFDINVGVADREKLQISSRLLSLAHSVESGHK